MSLVIYVVFVIYVCVDMSLLRYFVSYVFRYFLMSLCGLLRLYSFLCFLISSFICSWFLSFVSSSVSYFVLYVLCVFLVCVLFLNFVISLVVVR